VLGGEEKRIPATAGAHETGERPVILVAESACDGPGCEGVSQSNDPGNVLPSDHAHGSVHVQHSARVKHGDVLPSNDAVQGLNNAVGTASRTVRCVRYERSAPGMKSIQHSAQNVSMLTGNSPHRTAQANDLTASMLARGTSTSKSGDSRVC
jgi:hypothetical protein